MQLLCPGKEVEDADRYRFTAHPKGYHAAVRLSEDYAARARTELDIDEPSIDSLQALLLLTVASTASGKGKKAYMLLCTESDSESYREDADQI